MKRSSEEDSQERNVGSDANLSAIALCASCDRCRARKTRCDGKRPCSNCAAKYMKKNRLTSLDGVDLSELECIYSPAKRRGPVPGRTGTSRKSAPMGSAGQSPEPQEATFPLEQELQLRQMMQLQNQNAAQLALQQAGLVASDQGASNFGASASTSGFDPTAAAAAAAQHQALQQQLNLLQQLQAQQKLVAAAGGEGANGNSGAAGGGTSGNGGISNSSPGGMTDDDLDDRQPSLSQQPTRRQKVDATMEAASGVPPTVAAHTRLLQRNDAVGSRLRAYYRLSVDELFALPPIPTDEEYCMRLNLPGISTRLIPGTHLAALSAARFAEVSLGALVHNDVTLALELCNAVVHCLRESVQEPVQPAYMYEVARSYFLLGVFRAFRGDMERYFKYRRVCLTYLSKLNNDASTNILLAAVSFLDCWAYMMYNADEKKIPQIDNVIPRVEPSSRPDSTGSTAVEQKFNVKLSPSSVATDPQNQNWIQGVPPVYLNNDAPLPARALDALACAVRSCCDQANSRFQQLAKATDTEGQPLGTDKEDMVITDDTIHTPTSTAVLAHENELCSRNVVLSAFTLLQQHEASTATYNANQGIHLVISAMDAFLENGDEDGDGGGGFTDSQVQSLLSVCNTVIENPYLLHHGGPTYHMVTNAAVLLCHLLNGMHETMEGSDDGSGPGVAGEMEQALFEEVLDTLVATRKLLQVHRRKLPVKLRCHGIPRPSSLNFSAQPQQSGPRPFIDLGETLLCACRGCQGFVLMACSPCVAAERARAANSKREIEAKMEEEAEEAGDLDNDLAELAGEFDLDDDALLSMLSHLITA